MDGEGGGEKENRCTTWLKRRGDDEPSQHRCVYTRIDAHRQTHMTQICHFMLDTKRRERKRRNISSSLFFLSSFLGTHTHTLRNFSFMSFVPKGDITLFEKCDTESYKELTNTHRHTRCLRLSRTFCPMNRWSEAGHTHTHTEARRVWITPF